MGRRTKTEPDLALPLGLLFVACVLGGLVLLVVGAQAQVLAEADQSSPRFVSVLWRVYTVVEPIVVLLVSTIGPLVVTWIVAKLSKIMNVQEEVKKKELEEKLRTALHDSARRAVSYAVETLSVRLGSNILSPRQIDTLIKEARSYVLTKNRETVEQLGATQTDVDDIIVAHIGMQTERLRAMAQSQSAVGNPAPAPDSSA